MWTFSVFWQHNCADTGPGGYDTLQNLLHGNFLKLLNVLTNLKFKVLQSMLETDTSSYIPPDQTLNSLTDPQRVSTE